LRVGNDETFYNHKSHVQVLALRYIYLELIL